MALHPTFPSSPYAPLLPELRWFPADEYDKPGRYAVAVKVIDIFGNDTMTLVPVVVG